MQIVLTHKIAGITYRTETNTKFSRLEEEQYDRFRISNESKPDALFRICKVAFDSVIVSGIDEKERHFLFENARCKDGLDSFLLRTPLVRRKLHAMMNQPCSLEIWLLQEAVIFRDFLRNELDIFISEKFGGFYKEGPGYFPELHLGANFRQIYATFLPSYYAILIHASGVIRSGKSAIFLAPNSGGKTTVMNQANGELILSDDQVVLRKHGNVIMTYATPLGYTTSGPCQARLGGLFVLDQGSQFELTPLNPADLVQCLWTEHENYTFFLPKHLRKRAYNILVDACYQAPVFRMRFQKNYVDWDAIDAAMII